jgi:hypothetical protein
MRKAMEPGNQRPPGWKRCLLGEEVKNRRDSVDGWIGMGDHRRDPKRKLRREGAMLEDVQGEKEEDGKGAEVVCVIERNRWKEFHDFIPIVEVEEELKDGVFIRIEEVPS